MSNFLGLATVTAALRLELKHALDEEALAMPAGMVHGATVTAARPDSPATTLPDHGVNIFLYRVTPNTARRNEDLPSRDTASNLLQRPRAAADLHYLLTFYGADSDLETERLMGVVIRRLHERAILSRAAIELAINDASSPYLAASNLADDEDVRLTPEDLTLDDFSKLWSVLMQTAYRPSLTYRASVVMLESDALPRTTLPVRAYDVEVITLPHPAIVRVSPAPASVGTTEITIEGTDVLSDDTVVLIDGQEPDLPIGLGPTASSLRATVPLLRRPPWPPFRGLTPGIHTVQVVRRVAMGRPGAPAVDPAAALPNATPHLGFASNTVVLGVPPTMADKPRPVPDSADPRIELVAPGAERDATLLLYARAADGASYTLRSRPRAPAATPDTQDAEPFVFSTTGVAPGDYLVRLQVGGATSALEPDGIGPYTGPEVTVP